MNRICLNFIKTAVLSLSLILSHCLAASESSNEMIIYDPKSGMLGGNFENAMANARTEFEYLTKKSKNGNAQAIIVTLPDPSDTCYMREFDLMLDALMQAAAANKYSFYSHYFPWKYSEATAKGTRVNRSVPGVLLFEGEGAPLYMFIVGESPTKGVQHLALIRALEEVDKLSENNKTKISVLGPTYSGSIRSIDIAIDSWVKKHLIGESDKSYEFNFVSGTATGEKNADRINRMGQGLGKNIQFKYGSTATSDERKHTQILEFIEDKYGFSGKDIVTLVENTTFGSNVEKVNEDKINEDKFNREKVSTKNRADERITTFPFPLHIAQIQVDRMAVDSEQNQSAAQKSETVRKYLKLEFDSTSQKSDIPLPYAPKMSSRSGELVVGEIMKKIRKTGAKVVGIVATDIRDQLFLVNEIKRVMPNIVVFTYEVDVLLAHPFYKKATKGMLVASTNRLENTGGANKEVARFFSSDRAEGVFNAFIQINSGESASQQNVIISSPSNSGIWILHDMSKEIEPKPANPLPMYIPSIWKLIFLFLLIATGAYIYNLWTRNKGGTNYALEARTEMSRKQKTIRFKLYLSMATVPFLISYLISNTEMKMGMNIVIKLYWIIQLAAIIYFVSSYLIESLAEIKTRYAKGSRIRLFVFRLLWIHWAIIKSFGTLLLFWLIMIMVLFFIEVPANRIDWLVRLLSINSGVSPLLPLLLFSSVLIHYYWVQLEQSKIVEKTLYYGRTSMSNIAPVKILNSFIGTGVERRKIFIPTIITLILIPMLYILFEYSGIEKVIFPLTMFELRFLVYLINAGFVISLLILVTMSIKYFMNYNQLMSFLDQTKAFLRFEEQVNSPDTSGFFKNIFADDTPFMLELLEQSEKNSNKMAKWEQLKEEQRSIEILYNAVTSGRGVNALLETITSTSKDRIKIEKMASLYCKDIKEHFLNQTHKKGEKIVRCDELEKTVKRLEDCRERLVSALYVLFTRKALDELLKVDNKQEMLEFVDSIRVDSQQEFNEDIEKHENLASLNELKLLIEEQVDSSSDINTVKKTLSEISSQEMELAKRLIEHARESNCEVILDVQEEVREAFKSSTVSWLKILIPLLRRQLSFNIYSSIVILLGIMSYPFYPGQALLTWVGCIVVLIAIISTNTIIQMDRDAVLSALFTKNRDKIGINNSFANGIARYSAAPISMVFLSQSQWLQDSLSQFITPLLNSMFG